MTLVEVIVSVAILGVIAISILPLFGISIKSVARSGKRDESIKLRQNEMVEKIREYENPEITEKESISGVENVDPPIKVTIPGVTDDGIKVYGYKLEIEKDEMKIQTFIPKEDQ